MKSKVEVVVAIVSSAQSDFCREFPRFVDRSVEQSVSNTLMCVYVSASRKRQKKPQMIVDKWINCMIFCCRTKLPSCTETSGQFLYINRICYVYCPHRIKWIFGELKNLSTKCGLYELEIFDEKFLSLKSWVCFKFFFSDFSEILQPPH